MMRKYARYWKEYRITMALFPESIKSSSETLRHSKPFFTKMSNWQLTWHCPDLLKSSSRSGRRPHSDLNIVSIHTLKGQSLSAPSKIRSFSRYCLEPASPRPQRYPNHFARGSVEVRPRTSLIT